MGNKEERGESEFFPQKERESSFFCTGAHTWAKTRQRMCCVVIFIDSLLATEWSVCPPVSGKQSALSERLGAVGPPRPYFPPFLVSALLLSLVSNTLLW